MSEEIELGGLYTHKSGGEIVVVAGFSISKGSVALVFCANTFHNLIGKVFFQTLPTFLRYWRKLE